ncbi:hypothetical protein [Streptomyces sp. SYP-A7185]|uniref:hypothetical protein n=1 Tax=Streptomyces sp. SYP-A7185 TaxID=3040076 RepID=UPI0038F713C1
MSLLPDAGPGEAFAKAKKSRMPASWPASRRAHVWIDRGRSEMESGHHQAALHSIMKAREVAPQQTRYHPGARATIEGLVQQQRRTPDALSYLSSWLGL